MTLSLRVRRSGDPSGGPDVGPLVSPLSKEKAPASQELLECSLRLRVCRHPLAALKGPRA